MRGGGHAVGGVGAGALISLPQPPQNFAMGSFSKPQPGHSEGRGDPHSAQKRLVAALSAMHFRQRIGCSQAREPIRLDHNRKAMILEARAERNSRVGRTGQSWSDMDPRRGRSWRGMRGEGSQWSASFVIRSHVIWDSLVHSLPQRRSALISWRLACMPSRRVFRVIYCR